MGARTDAQLIKRIDEVLDGVNTRIGELRISFEKEHPYSQFMKSIYPAVTAQLASRLANTIYEVTSSTGRNYRKQADGYSKSNNWFSVYAL